MDYDEVAIGAAGAAAGGAAGFTALYFGGITGISAAGITSGLAAIGGNMVGGIGVIAALPLAGCVGAYSGYKALRQRSIQRRQTPNAPRPGLLGVRCCGLPFASQQVAP